MDCDCNQSEDALLSDRSIRRRAAARARKIAISLQNEALHEEEIVHSDVDSEGLSVSHVNDAPSSPEPDSTFIDDMENESDASDSVHSYSTIYSAESNSSSDSDGDDDDLIDFKENLRDWCLKSSTPIVHINSLLHLLQPHFPSLPKDGRTLLHTVRTYDIKSVAGGKYHHFGISEGIKARLENNRPLSECSALFLQVNIDGLPLFKSTSDCFWPILGMLRQETEPEPFVIGLWVGTSKPTDANAYLQPFIDDMKIVMAEGISFGDKIFPVSIENFVCDTPARSFVKITKGHSGYDACDYCDQHGEYYMHRMTFPEVSATARTDIAFDEMTCEEHHRGPSNLRDLNIGMITRFPLDYMHAICLGIMKKLINIWIRGPLNVRVGGNTIQFISEGIVALQSYLPREFARKGRKLSFGERFVSIPML